MPYEVQIGRPLKFVAKGSITVGDAARGIPASDLDKVIGGETEVLLTIETDQIRIAFGGAAATTTDHRYNVDDSIRVAGSATCRAMTFIRVTNDATVRYTIFGRQD